MCGIIGYKGKGDTLNYLIEGLKKLEYRGYDSAGIALKKDDNIQIIKSLGKIVNLEEKINSSNIINANLGIAHTRWATHGEPSEDNAHPHKVGKIIVVHNGIIENADSIRRELIKEGVEFKSSTDTEVIAAVINKYYKGDMTFALNQAIKELKGSYALGIIAEGDDNLYAIRCESPLILGVGKDEYFITSDIGAIINHTNKYVLYCMYLKIAPDRAAIVTRGLNANAETYATTHATGTLTQLSSSFSNESNVKFFG